MQATNGFLLAMAVSLLSSTIILAVILSPLRQVLSELCERGGSGPRFWTVFTALMLYLTPLLITAYAYTPRVTLETFFIVRRAVISALFAAVLALAFVGWQIARQSAQANSGRGAGA
jgi:hypothetical protein